MFTNYEVHRAKQALIEGNVAWVGPLDSNRMIYAQRLVHAAINGVSRREAFVGGSIGRWEQIDSKEKECMAELVRAARSELARDARALHESEYGGVYQVSVDGDVLAEFIPGADWSDAYRGLLATFGDRISYTWKPVSKRTS